MEEKSWKSMSCEVSDAVATISLCGPGKGNALGPDFWSELPEVFGHVGARNDVRAVILRGSGKTFSYGLDLMANAALFGPMLAGNPGASDRAALLRTISSWQDAVSSIARCEKPVIAAIHGWCIGGGLHLVSAADERLASADARFSLREVKLAICPDLGALERLPGIIGQGATRRLAFTGEDIGAEVAREMRLVSEVMESPEALFERANALAREIAANPPAVVQGIKRLLNAPRENEVEQGLRYVAAWNAAFLASNDLREAMTAFMEKRSPHFTGE